MTAPSRPPGSKRTLASRAVVWRKIGLQTSALGLSLLVHGCMLVALGLMQFRAQPPREATVARELIVDTVISEPSGPITIPELPPPMPPPATAVASGSSPTSSLGASKPSTIGAGIANANPPNAASSPGGNVRGASFFGLQASGKRIVYMIDRSGSMEADDAFEIAKRELVTSLKQLPRGTRFAIIAYNERPRLLATDARDFAEANATNIVRIRKQLESLEPIGGTNHLQAIHRAAALRPDAIFWLTDADDVSDRVAKSIAKSIQPRRGPAPSLAIVQMLRRNTPGESDALPALCKSCQGSFRSVELLSGTAIRAN